MMGTMGEARVPNPTPRLRSIHQRTIQSIIVARRLLDPFNRHPLMIADYQLTEAECARMSLAIPRQWLHYNEATGEWFEP